MMQLPVKAHYAVLAMLALAQSYASGKLLTARQIAKEHGIPPQFLGQILQLLRAAGLIESSRGPQGGFMLTRPPNGISLAQILDAVCPRSEGWAGGRNGEPESPWNSALIEVWAEMSARQREWLEGIALDTIMQRAAESNLMFYI